MTAPRQDAGQDDRVADRPFAPARTWSSDRLATLFGLAGPSPSWHASGISIDSRTIGAGELFVALSGEQFDGHDFIGDAMAKGAAGALVERLDAAGTQDSKPGRLLPVPDARTALAKLGKAGRAGASGTILGVTGSVGKTTTKDLLAHALAAHGTVAASQGGLNNEIGLPLSLARLHEDARYGVFEMGMNHKGELDALSRLARPHLALITRIAPAHTAFFPSLRAIAEAKAEIFAGLEGERIAILPRDDPYFPLLHARAGDCGARIFAFGRHKDADLHLRRVRTHDGFSVVTCAHRERVFTFRLGLPGRQHAMNAAAVLAALCALGLDPVPGFASFARARARPGRGRRLWAEHRDGTGFLVIDESYNASPASCRAAFDTLKRAHLPDHAIAKTDHAIAKTDHAIAKTNKGRVPRRRIAILGDMLELGARGPAMHRALARPLASCGIDQVHGAGKLTALLLDALPKARQGLWACTSREGAASIAASLAPDDIVLVKGSLAMEMRWFLQAIAERVHRFTPLD